MYIYMTASNGQHGSLSISTLTFHYRTHILTIVAGAHYRNVLDQAEFHTYSKMGLYMNLGAQPDHARPSQAKDLIDTEDNIYVRCYL